MNEYSYNMVLTKPKIKAECKTETTPQGETMTILYRGCIAASITSRAGALEKLRKELEQITMHDDLYKAELRAAAPPSWNEFFEAVGLIDCLFTHGRYIGTHSLDEYGLTSNNKVRSMINDLLAAWPDLITITARTYGRNVDFRFHVTFG